jgi:hypothetical protein
VSHFEQFSGEVAPLIFEKYPGTQPVHNDGLGTPSAVENLPLEQFTQKRIESLPS